MRVFDTNSVSDGWLSAVLMALVAPRPIALVSTVSRAGTRNLAPFSFFNICSVRPPVVMFSSLRRLRDGSSKDTERNLLEIPECTIQIVTEELLYPQHIAAVDFPPEIDEFEKAGLTPQNSIHVSAPLVAEAKLKMECKMIETTEFGTGAGSARVFFCEVLVIHVAETHLHSDDSIDASNIRHLGRQSGPVYCRSFGSALFDLAIPKSSQVVGVDMVPEKAKVRLAYDSELIARLASTERLPSAIEVQTFWENFSTYRCRGAESLRIIPESLIPVVSAIMQSGGGDSPRLTTAIRAALDLQSPDLAWHLALYEECH